MFALLIYLVVLIPWCCQESVRLINRNQAPLSYLSSLGINTLGMILGVLVCFPLWFVIPMELVAIVVQPLVYGFLISGVNRRGIGPIKGLGVTLLVDFLLLLPILIMLALFLPSY